jgi:hypothetical protein
VRRLRRRRYRRQAPGGGGGGGAAANDDENGGAVNSIPAAAFLAGSVQAADAPFVGDFLRSIDTRVTSGLLVQIAGAYATANPAPVDDTGVAEVPIGVFMRCVGEWLVGEGVFDSLSDGTALQGAPPHMVDAVLFDRAAMQTAAVQGLALSTAAAPPETAAAAQALLKAQRYRQWLFTVRIMRILTLLGIVRLGAANGGDDDDDDDDDDEEDDDDDDDDDDFDDYDEDDDDEFNDGGFNIDVDGEDSDMQVVGAGGASNAGDDQNDA